MKFSDLHAFPLILTALCIFPGSYPSCPSAPLTHPPPTGLGSRQALVFAPGHRAGLAPTARPLSSGAACFMGWPHLLHRALPPSCPPPFFPKRKKRSSVSDFLFYQNVRGQMSQIVSPTFLPLFRPAPPPCPPSTLPRGPLAVTASGTHTWMVLSAAHGESPQVPRHNQQGLIHPPGAFAKVASRTVSCPRLPQPSVVGAAWPRAAERSQCCEAGDQAQPLPLAGLGFPTAECRFIKSEVVPGPAASPSSVRDARSQFLPGTRESNSRPGYL